MSASSTHSEPASADGFAETYPVIAPEYYNFAYDVVDKAAQADRNRLAMIWTNQQGEERRYTFYDFSRLSNEAANYLVQLGITRGDRVFIQLPRIPEWWIFSLALIKLGAVQCIAPTLLTPTDIAHRISFAKIKMVITDMENAPKFDEVHESCPTLHTRVVVDGCRPGWESYANATTYPSHLSRSEVNVSEPIKTKSSDPMLLIYTSGTSKFPKLVQHNFAYPLGHRVTAELWHGLTANDLHFTVSDTGWGKNLWGNYFGQWILGACVFIYDIRGKFHAAELLPLIEKYGITSFCAPPTIYRMLVLHDLTKFNFGDLHCCTSAGEALHTETAQRWKENTGIEIREAYGQSETVCIIGNFIYNKNCPGAMGKPAPGWDIEIHDDQGKRITRPNDPGRIAVKIDQCKPVGFFDKYVNNEEESAACFSNGYYYTGDRAKCDENGYYWFIGRSDDIIKSSGYRIGPSEVEEAMMQHKAVSEVAVVGAPDPLRGARVKAYVVLHPEFEATESLVFDIQKHTKQLTAPYKYPREIEFLKQLPKTYSGKIKRDLLTKHAATGEISWE